LNFIKNKAALWRCFSLRITPTSFPLLLTNPIKTVVADVLSEVVILVIRLGELGIAPNVQLVTQRVPDSPYDEDCRTDHGRRE
jgi:hypothetical protein